MRINKYIMERISGANYQNTKYGHWEQVLSNYERYKVKLNSADDIYITQVLPRLLANTHQVGIQYISIETVMSHFDEWLTLGMLNKPGKKSIEDLRFITVMDSMIIILSSHYDFYVIQNVELISGTIYLSTESKL